MLKVGLISYPMLFQMQGGLQVQMVETLKALIGLGVDAQLVDPIHEELEQYDIIHIFGISHGNYHIAQIANKKGCKVVVSPLVRNNWDSKIAFRVNLIDKFLGKFSNYLTLSRYSAEKEALLLCDHVIALGDGEEKAIYEAFDVSKKKISKIGNGVSANYFSAKKGLFTEITGINYPYILQVGTINNNKNQLLLARCLKEYFPDIKLVLIGPVDKHNERYLEKVENVGNVKYLGGMEPNSELLASAYSSALVNVLPSYSEVYGLTAIESLASGTPVLLTKDSLLRFECVNNEFHIIEPSDMKDIAMKLKLVLDSPPLAYQCKSLVQDFTWKNVAKKLIGVYLGL